MLSTVIIVIGWNITLLNSQSVITIINIALSFSEGSRPITKFTDILAYY